MILKLKKCRKSQDEDGKNEENLSNFIDEKKTTQIDMCKKATENNSGLDKPDKTKGERK